MWGVLPDFFQLGQVIISDQWLVLVERPQRFFRLRRVGVDDLVPDEILLRFWWEAFNVFIDQHELRQRGHIEARPGFVERADDGRFRIGFDGVVSLHLRQMLFELGVVLPNDVVVNHDNGRAVLVGEGLKALGGHGISIKWLMGFKRFC